MLKLRRSKEIPEVAITVTTETFIRLALLTVGTIILLIAAHKAAHALLLIFTAFFLALALNSPVRWIGARLPGKRRDNRTLATTLSFLIVLLLITSFVFSVGPPLVKQTENFANVAPSLVRDFRGQDSWTGRFIRDHHLDKQVDSVSNQLSQRLKHAGGSAFSTAQRVGSSVFSMLTIWVLTFMMLIEGPRWLGLMRDMIPDRHHVMTDRVSRDMYKVIKGFVNGQVALSALASVMILPAVLILHIGYPVALLVVIFLCGLIPMIGHTIGAIIVTLVALFHSTGSALIILAYYILYQQIENYLIQPRVQANTTNMSPLLVFMSVVIGISFGGLFGGLVAIPVGGCLRIAALEYLHTKNIIDEKTFEKVTTETR